MIDNLFSEIKINDEKSEICILSNGNTHIRLLNAKTKKVTYCKDTQNFCFCFLPSEVDSDTKFYEIKVESEKHSAEVMLNAMYKLSTKKWYDIDVQQDFLELFRFMIGENQWHEIESYTK